MKKLKVITAVLCLATSSIMFGLAVENFIIKPLKGNEQVEPKLYTVYQGELTFKNLKRAYSHVDYDYSVFTTYDGRLVELAGTYTIEEQKPIRYEPY